MGLYTPQGPPSFRVLFVELRFSPQLRIPGIPLSSNPTVPRATAFVCEIAFSRESHRTGSMHWR